MKLHRTAGPINGPINQCEENPHGRLHGDPHRDLPASMQALLPVDVDVVQPLGYGRAAKAVLVDATMADGSVVRCVEKVFAPGRLTRSIYRIAFQAPFAYQANMHAILTAFYRRRVAAAAISASEVDADVANPLYVRFDSHEQAWVLAAEWIDGRGIRPAPAEVRADSSTRENHPPEIQQILRTMRSLETVLSQCGLVGSGWQVAPSAMVSTANLLRTGDRYTVIDLESGIPAVLVPKYLVAGFLGGCIPPFDDLDPDRMRSWIEKDQKLLTFRLGPDAVDQLNRDVQDLLQHDDAWKSCEIAAARQPGKFFRRQALKPYQDEYVRQLRQHNRIDIDAPSSRRLRAIWWAGCVPTRVGDFLQTMIGHRDQRDQAIELLTDPAVRSSRLNQWIAEKHDRMIGSNRLPDAQRSTKRILAHALFSKVLPTSLHRYFSDTELRAQRRRQMWLLAFSPDYQSWFGQRQIDQSIANWHDQKRISEEEAKALHSNRSGDLVRAYVRGFGLHFALKGLAPIWVPIKITGIAAFVSTGNAIYLTPFLITPLLRLAVTLQSWWAHRGSEQHRGRNQGPIPHREAMWLGCLPVVGLVAFPMQMFSARPALSSFLIRDVASKIGRRLPIYGGKDSRTEIACIRVSDYLIAALQQFDQAIKRLTKSDAKISQEVSSPEYSSAQPSIPIETMKPASRFQRWIAKLAKQEIQRQQAATASGSGRRNDKSEPDRLVA